MQMYFRVGGRFLIWSKGSQKKDGLYFREIIEASEV